MQSLRMNEARKMSAWQIGLIGLGGLMGVVLLALFNYGVLDTILIPDPCYYHSHDTNWLFDIFYDITSAEGGHPSPSTFNLVITFIGGVLLGGWLTFRSIWAWQKKSIDQGNNDIVALNK